MTRLTKPVIRQAAVSSAYFRSGQVVVTIHPKGWVGVREAGRRAQYKMRLETLIDDAVKITIAKMGRHVQVLRRQHGYKLGQARREAAMLYLANHERVTDPQHCAD
jgi:hypothetical protein